MGKVISMYYLLLFKCIMYIISSICFYFHVEKSRVTQSCKEVGTSTRDGRIIKVIVRVRTDGDTSHHHILSLAACCSFVGNGRGAPLHKLHIGRSHQ